MSDYADERRDVRLWDDGFAVGQQTERQRMHAVLRAIDASYNGWVHQREVALLREVAAALGVTLEQDGGE